MKELLTKYPSAYAIYDLGKYYGVGVQESFYLVDKETLEVAETLLRYENRAIELIENAIPIWFAEDAD